MSKDSYNLVRKEYPQLAAIIEKILKSAVIYTMNEGIFILRKYQKIGNGIVYGDVLTTAKNKLYYLISSNRELEIIDNCNFLINEIKIGGADFGVMVFS